MRIERIAIDKFGGLRGFEKEFGAGLTVIYGGNESGKTTLAAFVRAMLYGLNGKSASVAQNERRKYMPWGETAMGGSLRLTDGRESYEIVRVFGQTKKNDSCRVVCVSTGEVLPIPAGQEPGDVLLGIEESVYLDALYLSVRGGKPVGGAALAERIRNRMDTGQEDVDLQRVMERLQTAKSAILPRVRDRGELAKVRSELDTLRKTVMQENALKQQAAQLEQKLNTAKARSVPDPERLQALLRSLADVEVRIRQLEGKLDEQEAREQEVKKRRKRRAIALGICAAAVAVASVALGLMWKAAAFAGLAAAAALAVGMVLCLLSGTKKVQQAAVDDILAQLSQLRQDRAMLKQQMSKPEVTQSAPAEEWVQDRVRLERLQTELEQLNEAKRQMEALEKREAELLRRAAALEMAQEELRGAAQERRQSVAPMLLERTQELLCALTGARYEYAALDGEMMLSLQADGGALRSWEYFSAGTVEQMYLALRLSLADLLAQTHGALPLVMDDPFAAYDDARTADALALLRSWAQEGKQVLLLTCRERETKGVKHVVRMK